MVWQVHLVDCGYVTSGINFEHLWGDGVAVLRYFQEIFKETTEAPYIHPHIQPKDSSKQGNVVLLIDFKLDDRIQHGIATVRHNHNTINNLLDMNYLKYEKINKNICKKQRISPDSVMQLGFQLAFFKQHGTCVGTYESSGMAAFRHDRTEAMRPCTMATKELRMGWTQIQSPFCWWTPGDYGKMGQGFNRHLFGLRPSLRHIAQTNDIAMPCHPVGQYALIAGTLGRRIRTCSSGQLWHRFQHSGWISGMW